MASWKKVIVSGSNISELNNDANYLTSATLGDLVSGSSAAARTNLNSITSGELDQLLNINSVTISNTQWGYVGALDQGLTTTSNVNFEKVIANSITASFSGNLDGDVVGSVIGNVTGNADTATTADTASYVAVGDIDGDIIALSASLASQAEGINVDTSNDAVDYKLVFVDAAGDNKTLSTDQTAGDLIYRPSSGKLTVPIVVGQLSGGVTGSLIGDVTGTADTASYVAAGNIDGAVANATTATTASYVSTGGDISGLIGDVNVEAIQGVSLTSAEATQLANIGTTTISAAQWGYVGALDQSLRSGDNVSFSNLTLSGDLVVNGTTTTINTSNLEVEDRFIFLNEGSGSAAPAGEGGIIVEGTTAGQGDAFYYDGNSSRWSLASAISKTATSVTAEAFVSAVVDVDGGQTDDARFQVNGNIKVEGGDIYIYS